MMNYPIETQFLENPSRYFHSCIDTGLAIFNFLFPCFELYLRVANGIFMSNIISFNAIKDISLLNSRLFIISKNKLSSGQLGSGFSTGWVG